MFLIENNNINPFFNLAAEEYLLKEFSEDFLMFYQNSPSVIVGKHQNTLAEINYQFIRENNIIVARRLSGGGTVFHDEGNLNFSFICSGIEEKMIDFKKFTQPFIDALADLGVNAQHTGKSDISVSGLKISGNAEHIYRNRILHHGTLLFSSDLSFLSASLKTNPARYIDKSVKSVKSPVTNIKENISQDLNISQFKTQISKSVQKTFGSFDLFKFSLTDLEAVNSLIKEKYQTWEWNFGYSPDYKFINQNIFQSELSTISFEVEKGIIKKVAFTGTLPEKPQINFIIKALQGIKHEFEPVKNSLINAGLDVAFSVRLAEQFF